MAPGLGRRVSQFRERSAKKYARNAAAEPFRVPILIGAPRLWAWLRNRGSASANRKLISGKKIPRVCPDGDNARLSGLPAAGECRCPERSPKLFRGNLLDKRLASSQLSAFPTRRIKRESIVSFCATSMDALAARTHLLCSRKHLYRRRWDSLILISLVTRYKPEATLLRDKLHHFPRKRAHTPSPREDRKVAAEHVIRVTDPRYRCIKENGLVAGEDDV